MTRHSSRATRYHGLEVRAMNKTLRCLMHDGDHRVCCLAPVPVASGAGFAHSLPRFPAESAGWTWGSCETPCFPEWAVPGLNRGPSDFQSLALPTELTTHVSCFIAAFGRLSTRTRILLRRFAESAVRLRCVADGGEAQRHARGIFGHLAHVLRDSHRAKLRPAHAAELRALEDVLR